MSEKHSSDEQFNNENSSKVNSNCADQRAQLHKTIWAIADDMRGSVDGWDFKQYVLCMLFYRFISEYLTSFINKDEAAAGNTDFDYAKISDEMAAGIKDSIVKEKGLFIPPSELFCNVLKDADKNENLNMTLEQVFKNMEASAIGEDSEEDIKGLFNDMDVNSPKLGNNVDDRNKKLATLMHKIDSLDFGGSFDDNNIDAFGDAYEYLMNMYASNAGKSGGEFFTPQEIGELLARIVLIDKDDVKKVYDPCCGSGSLLLKFAKILGPRSHFREYCGQEINLTSYNLARMNMFLHDISFEDFDIKLGDTLKDPKHKDKEPFDAIVSNPPYSTKWEGKDNPLNLNDQRFSPAGALAPKSKADLAFTMHMLSWLSTDGTAAIVEFPGVLYRGGAEAKIRKYLVENNYVDAVIQLPADCFFGTSIATCILVLKKSKETNDILFVDASSEFKRFDTKNHLTEQNIDHIIAALKDREDVDYFAKVVSNADVLENDANLSVSSYVEKEDTREKIDIDKLNAKIKCIVVKEQELREQIDAIVEDLDD